MTSEDQVGTDDENVLRFITEQKKEKQEYVDMISEMERQVRAKQQLETKIKVLRKILQEAMQEAILSEKILHVGLNLQTGVEELEQKLQETSALAMQLRREVDAKSKLETKIEEFKEKLMVENYMIGEQSIEKMKAKLDNNMEEIDSLEDLNQMLFLKERQSNDELLEVRNVLIRGFADVLSGRSYIGIRKMGEIDMKPFKKVLEEKHHPEAEITAAHWCSLWQGRVEDPTWHPFTIVASEDGSCEETVNEGDELVKGLRDLGSDEIYEAVINALKEMNEYNPSGRYVVSEIWNFMENRKATTKEAVAYLLNHLKMMKRKRG